METKVVHIHQELVEECLKGSSKAAYQLYKLYSKAMLNTAYRIVGDEDDAKDVVQEAFIKAFEKLAEFQGTATFGSWLKRIVVNQGLNHLRKKAPLNPLEEIHQELADDDESQNWEELIGQVDRLKSAIKLLPEGYKVIFSLYMIEGYEHQEIAEILGISLSTSKSQLLRAKQKLKEILLKEGFSYGR